MQIISHIIFNEKTSFRSDLYTAIKGALSSYSNICFEEGNLIINNIKEQHGRYFVRFTIEFDNVFSGDDNNIVENIFESISALVPNNSTESGLLKYYDEKQLEINKTFYAKVYDIEMKIREVLFYILWNKYGSKDIYKILSRFGSDFNVDPAKNFKDTFDHQLFYIMFSRYKELTKYQNLNTFLISNNQTNNAKEIFLNKTLGKYDSIDELLIYLKSLWIDDQLHLGLLKELQEYLDAVEKLRNAIAHNRHLEQEIIDNAVPAMDSINRLIVEFWRNDAIHDDQHLKDTITEWFLDNYEDPANGVPYNSSEGGYQYWNGGPFYASDVIAEKFIDIDEEIIEKAVEEVEYECTEWVRKGDY